MIEIWKLISEIPGYEHYTNYSVSNLGKVKNNKTNRILKGMKTKEGYIAVRVGDRVKSYKIHRLVALAFIPNPNPTKFDQINHKDENPANNKVDNLEWCDTAYNVNYGHHNENIAITLSLQRKSKKFKHTEQSKQKMSTSHSTNKQVSVTRRKVIQKDLNGNIIRTLDSMSEGLKYGFTPSAISACCRGARKLHKGFIFEYEDGGTPKKWSQPIVQLDLDSNFIKIFELATDIEKEGITSANGVNNCCHNKSFISGCYKWMFLSDYNNLLLSQGKDIIEFKEDINKQKRFRNGSIVQCSSDFKFIKLYNYTFELKEDGYNYVTIMKAVKNQYVLRNKRWILLTEFLKYKNINSLNELKDNDKIEITSENIYKNKDRLKIIQIDLQTNAIIRIFNSVKELTDAGFNIRSVRTCCQGRSISSQGFYWKYKED